MSLNELSIQQACESPMASTSTHSLPSTSSSSSDPEEWEVFLSFRGEDTRHTFADALYHAMKNMGIDVFRDKEDLEVGEEINPTLAKAIKESRYAVIVISPQFAKSKACLFELTAIMKCMQMGRLKVFPVFYHVNPSELGELMKDVENVFTKPQGNPSAAKAKWDNWKSLLAKLGDYSVDPELDKDLSESCSRALKEASDLSAMVVGKDSYETEMAQEISFKIFSKLIADKPIISEHLVGIESRVIEIMKLLNIKVNLLETEVDPVRVIGICGIGGIGKTILAEIIYAKVSPQFRGRCFIYHIGRKIEHDLVEFQKQLISNILGEDVARSLDNDHKVKEVLRTKLRKKKAFIVLDDVWEKNQVDRLVGSLEWFGHGSRILITSRDHRLPHLRKENVYEVKLLEEKDALELFCWKAFGQPHPKEGFERENCKVQGIVLKLPLLEDEQLSLESLSAMVNLRVLQIKCNICMEYPNVIWAGDTSKFSNTQEKLRHYMYGNIGWEGDISKLKLRKNLCIMEWFGYPFKSLPLNFASTKLVELKLPRSCIERLWVGQKSFLALKVIDMRCSKRLITTPNLSQVPNLEILDLSSCENLQTIHGSLKRIKKLRLYGCHGLTEFLVEISLEFLEDLNLSECSKLTRITNVLGELPFFRYLNIRGTRISELPFKSTSFPSLEEFYAHDSDLQELPYDIAFAGKLRVLEISCNDSNTFKFPFSFSALSSLEYLTLGNCLQLNEEVPMGFGDLSSLCELTLSYNKITKLPDGVYKLPKLLFLILENCTKLELSEFRFENLTSLQYLDLSCCNLSTIPKSIGSRYFSISSLNLANNSFTELPDSICELPRLEFLDLSDCTSLRVLPKLPLGLEGLLISHCPLSAAFDSQRIKQISPELLQTKFCSSLVAYAGFDCKPHNILYAEKESFYAFFHPITPMRVGCVPVGEPRTLPGFICSNIISNKKIEVHMDWKRGKRFHEEEVELCFLSIVYEVTGESSDTGACEGSNPEILPVFVCQLQLKETIAEQIPELASQSQPNEESPVSVVVRVPKVAAVGLSYGVLVSMEIPDSMRRPKEERINISDVSGESEQVESSIGEPKCKKRKISDSSEESEPVKRWSLVASITASNERVKLKECWGRVFRGGHGKCEEVTREISRPGLDLKYLYHDSSTGVGVWGPIN